MQDKPHPVRLYNTKRRSLELLQPLSPHSVGVYCCGPTVYNYQHLGNLRTYLFEDFLVRTLRFAGYTVRHVLNITDVGHLESDADQGEDKMLLAARREGKTSEAIAAYYTDIFFKHCTCLNISKPTVVCKASEHIPQMIQLIARLEQNGFAYRSGGNVYFDVQKFERYGELARLDLEQLRAGARIEVDEQKKGPLDFALWFTKSKFSNQELQWDSPWGRGYPGWHVECSAMAIEHLGESFDIHCGGIDHIPVHHTNEIAQSECATGKPFAQVWLHGAFLVLAKDKMSKSSGNFLTLDTVKERGFDPLSYRLLCAQSSYRKELSWSWDALAGADNALKKLRSQVCAWNKELGNLREHDSAPGRRYNELIDKFRRELCNDLGTANSVAVMYEIMGDPQLALSEKRQLLSTIDTVLGLGIDTWQEHTVPQGVIILAQQRDAARLERNWALADTLREQILAEGYSVKDTPDGPEILPLRYTNSE